MQIKRPILSVLAVAAVAIFLLILVDEVMARGPGGGRGGGRRGGPRGGHRMGRMHHHRMGPASRGNFHTQPRQQSRMRRPPRSTSYRRPYNQGRPRRPTTPPPVQPSRPLPPTEVPSQEQLEKRAKMHDKKARRLEERREDLLEHEHRRRHREEVGTTYSSDYWDDYYGDDYCEAEVEIGGVTYYECEGNWFRRAYSEGAVNYVVVEGPRSD